MNLTCIQEMCGSNLVLVIDFLGAFHSSYKQMLATYLTIRQPVLSRFLLVTVHYNPISTRGPWFIRQIPYFRDGSLIM